MDGSYTPLLIFLIHSTQVVSDPFYFSLPRRLSSGDSVERLGVPLR